MSIPRALPTDPEPTHHITLTDKEGTVIGLIGCDGKAQRNDRAVVRTPLSRSGIKISQGQSQHSDLLPPFTEIEQSDWSGGLGALEFRDRSRYYHGVCVDGSSTGRLFIGPRPRFGFGYRNQDYPAFWFPAVPSAEDMWDRGLTGHTDFVGLYGPRRYAAFRFVASANYSAACVYIHARRKGKPAGSLTWQLRTDSAGDPGSVLRSGTVEYLTEGIDTLASKLLKCDFSGNPLALTSGTAYWFVVFGDSADNADNHYEIGVMGGTILDRFPGTGPFNARLPEVYYPGPPGAVTISVWMSNGSPWFITNGKAEVQGNALSYAFVRAPPCDVCVEADITRVNGEVGLTLGYLTTDNNVRCEFDLTSYRIISTEAGVEYSLAGGPLSWPAGETRRVLFWSYNRSYHLMVNGVHIASTGTRGSASTSKGYGLYAFSGTTSPPWNAFDNVRIRQTGCSKRSSDGSTWIPAEFAIRGRIADGGPLMRGRFFKYKEAVYAVLDWEAASGAPRLFINGDRGVATGSGSTVSMLRDTTKSWTVDEWKLSVIRMTGGTGKGQWGAVLSNDSDDIMINAAYPWRVAPVAGSTEYVLVGSDKWTEITGHGLTGPITDVLVSSKEVVYFAQGDAVNIRRMREFNSAGVWTRQFADDGTNKAVFLLEWQDQEHGPQILKANNTDADGNVSVARAAPQPWGTNLTFGAAIVCGGRDDAITGLENYDNPEAPYILKEGSIGRVRNDEYSVCPLREMATGQSRYNGVAHLVHNLYLYFSYGRSGMERFHRDVLDDVGPNRDDGLVPELQGPFSAMLGLPGVVLAAQGEYPYHGKHAAIFKYNIRGWQPFYVHPEAGMPIRHMLAQPIEGTTPDRLWVIVGSDIISLPLPSDTVDPTKDPLFEYYHQGLVRLSWNYFDYRDAPKFFDRLKVSADKLMAGSVEIVGRYNVDDGTGYHDFSTVVSESPTDGFIFRSNDGHQGGVIEGKRVAVDLVLRSENSFVSPVLRALVYSGVVFLDSKYRLDMSFRLKDNDTDLEGDEEQIVVNGQLVTSPSAKLKASILEGWARQGTLLRMRCVYSPYDDHIVSIDPETLRPWAIIPDEQEQTFVGQVGFVELR